MNEAELESLTKGYAEMADDSERERAAEAWSEALMGDVDFDA